MKGIYFNGIPLDGDDMIDLEIHRDSFTFHFIKKNIKERNHSKSHPRCSKVRKIEVKDEKVHTV